MRSPLAAPDLAPRISDFGFRISDFLRSSDFGPRILPQFPLLCLALLALSISALAQPRVQPVPQPDPLMSLMLAQPKINFDTPVIAVPTLDPSVIRPGEECIYRVTLNALLDSVAWPTNIVAPGLQVRPTASGQMLQMSPTSMEPRTTFNHRLRADKTGAFVIPEFTVQVYGKPVKVPSIKLEVSREAPPTAVSSQMLYLDFAQTNVWVGQSLRARILLPAGPGGAVQGLTQVQVTGQGFIVDPSAVRQSVQVVPHPGGRQSSPSFIYETALTPIRAGRIKLFAQGFAASSRFGNGFVVTGPTGFPGGVPLFNLLESDPIHLTVKPLPLQGELPGFTGAIGFFLMDPPTLSSGQTKVGEPIKISVTIRGRDSQARLVAPLPPLSRDWQIFPVTAESATPRPYNPAFIISPDQYSPLGSAKFEYTLVPMNDETDATPVIPFCAFNPETGAYYDLSIPAMPVRVAPSPVPVNTAALAQAAEARPKAAKEPALGPLASTPGSSAASLMPVQQRAWFPAVQLAPGLVFLALWYWDRRRRFLENHPEVVRRRLALRMLRRERQALRKAARASDAPKFAGAALRAMRAAAAPHYPAEPRALVGADILPLLSGSPEPAGEVVKTIFATCDASQFSDRQSADLKDLLQLQQGIETVLTVLESKLEVKP